MAVFFRLTTVTFLLSDLDSLTIEVFLDSVDLTEFVFGLIDTIVLLDLAIEGFLTVTILLMFMLLDGLFFAGSGVDCFVKELLVVGGSVFMVILTERFEATALVFVLLLTVGVVLLG